MSGKPRALVIDDEEAILRFLKPALEANGYDFLMLAVRTSRCRPCAGR